MAETASELRAIADPGELYVPLPEGSRPPPPGTTVRAGDALSREPHRRATLPTPRAPASGVITGERTIRLTSGRSVSAAVLQVVPTGPTDTGPRVLSQPFTQQVRDLLTADAPRRSALLNAIPAAGVWADRPTCPDLTAQLADTSGVDTVVCTALDPDAHLGICARLVIDAAPDLMIGALLAARICSAPRLLFVIEPTVPDRAKRELVRLAAEVTRAAAEVTRAAAEVARSYPETPKLTARAVALQNHYPRGDTSLLLLRLLRRRLPPGALPTSRGVLLLDAPAAVAIGRAARNDLLMLHLPLALADHTTGRRLLLRVPIGTPLPHLLRTLDLDPATVTVRTGDILQERIAPADAVLSPEDLYLHVLARKPAPLPDPCIRCGWCVEACPTHVHPAMALEAAQTRDLTLARRAHVPACIECGLCQYVCPSRLPLLGALRTLIPLLRDPATGGNPA